MKFDDSRRAQDVFAGAFKSMRQAACMLEPVHQRQDDDRDWRYIAFNPAMQRVLKVADLAGLLLRDVHPEVACEWHAYLERVVTSGTAETHVRQLGRKPMLLRIELTPLSSANGEAVLVQVWKINGKNVDAKPPKFPAAGDKTPAVNTQDQILNLISKVRSMAQLSAASHLKVDDYVDHLSGRLQAMSRTQSMLARLPSTRLNLRDLLEEELLANAIGRDQYIAECPDVALASHAAEIVTLVIHELATNSIKFGAFGETRTVRIGWTTADRDQVPWLNFSWKETCSRRAFTPLRKGFGTCLIEERIAYELKGEGRLHVHDAGVLAEFGFPLT